MNRSRLRKPLMLLAFLTACIVCVFGIVSTASRLNLEVKSFENGDALLSIWNIPIESEQHRLFLFRLIDANRIEPLTVERIRERKVYCATFDGDLQEVISPVVRERAKRIGGAGLGLALVKHTINAHHGEVLVKSLVGKGSEFQLCFPLKAS
ncbi:MAG: ATP-binding protein [Chloroherpetonaceae bacterium]